MSRGGLIGLRLVTREERTLESRKPSQGAFFNRPPILTASPATVAAGWQGSQAVRCRQSVTG